jgi:hypothetical protein
LLLGNFLALFWHNAASLGLLGDWVGVEGNALQKGPSEAEPNSHGRLV